VGIVFILAGVLVLLDSFARFAIQGLGTPAPIFPTRNMVVQGLYRYVRNPMYVALLLVVTGQALLFGNLHLLVYGAIVWLCTHLFVVLYEEPKLRAIFDDEYKTFCAHVPRWIPRLRPWDHSA
jgi:protein-S-isoprenylcysteine O-methyltransferase Ste14